MTAPDDPASPRSFVVRATNVQRVEHRIDLTDRARRNCHRSGVLWFTGLSGAGKSTLAIELETRLFGMGYQVYVLDGDNLRHGLCADLGFSPEDRTENIRRVGEVGAVRRRRPDLHHGVHLALPQRPRPGASRRRQRVP